MALLTCLKKEASLSSNGNSIRTCHGAYWYARTYGAKFRTIIGENESLALSAIENSFGDHRFLPAMFMDLLIIRVSTSARFVETYVQGTSTTVIASTIKLLCVYNIHH
jgi:hypothetical protein